VSAFDVLHHYGARALIGFLFTIAVFVALHLIRLPLLGAARALETAMHRVNARLTRAVDTPPAGPSRTRRHSRQTW